jgi:hypothetical protein
MRRMVASLVVAAGLSLAVVLPVSAALPQATPASTTVQKFSGRLAVALWSANDPYNTFVIVAGNDVRALTQTSGAPASASYSSVLVNLNQSYCDTSVDQLIFRSVSYIVNVDPSTVMVSGSLERARIHGTATFGGYEQRIPNCNNPDVFNRTITFPDVTVTTDLTFTQAGDVITYTAARLHDFSPGSGGITFKIDATGRPATVTGSVATSIPEARSLSVPAGAYASMASNSELVIRISV